FPFSSVPGNKLRVYCALFSLVSFVWRVSSAVVIPEFCWFLNSETSFFECAPEQWRRQFSVVSTGYRPRLFQGFDEICHGGWKCCESRTANWTLNSSSRAWNNWLALAVVRAFFCAAREKL